MNNPLILFDGVCNLCNTSVQFIIKHDKNNLFKFASLQSETGRKLLKKYNYSNNTTNTFVLIYDNMVYTKSDAALLTAKLLGSWWRLMYYFRFIPRKARNGIYSFIARNRYKWFGKSETCMIPDDNLKERFV